MISKVNKIKNLGLVFQDYSRKADLPVFRQTNLIYGWNGCGKTTLSRLFDHLGGNPLPGLEYEVEDDQGVKFNQADTFSRMVRVFNQDYIENNVKILDSRANSISILLGEENKELIEQIETDQKLLQGDATTPEIPGKIALQKEKALKARQENTARDTKFTEIARTIGAATGANALRNYRKPDAEADFKKLAAKSELKPDELDAYQKSARQESQPALDELSAGEIEIDDEKHNSLPLLDTITTKAAELVKQTVESVLIQRLTDNPDISDWVETGVALHKHHSSKICEYCRQQIPETRLKELTSHFNDADRTLKQNIDSLIGQLTLISNAISADEVPKTAQFYPSLHKKYTDLEVPLTDAKKALLDEIEKLGNELSIKKTKTTEELAITNKPDSKLFSDLLDQANTLIEKHNITTTDFESVKTEAVTKLKEHYLSTIYDEIHAADTTIAGLEKDSGDLLKEIAEIQKRITDALAQISSDHKACDFLNEKLSMFLGHKELQFKPHIETELDENGNKVEVSRGYDIMRGESLATKLSEGEKTAIAFVYFVVHLGDKEFDVSEGIIVIDDPISSLDSNSLYQAFSFLKNAVRSSKQCFILTHNFDFLKLLLNWRHHDSGKTGHFMIKNTFVDDTRTATVEKMDRELCEYESEYHYLFKLLKRLRDEQDDTIARAYPIPNIARKVWDTFTMFSVPSGQSAYKKIEALKQAGYDETKLDAIYKFVNDQSHITGSGFDPALVAGTKKAILDMFDMMSTISPDHFKIIDQSTND